MASHEIFRHGLPEEVADGVWRVRGTLSFPLPRFMTVLKLASGGLLIYSAIAMNDEGMAALEALGQPQVLLVPHFYHTMDASFFTERYPDMQVIAPSGIHDKLAKMGVKANAGVEALKEHDINYRLVAGSKCSEVVLDLDTDAGRALVFTDIVSTAPKKGLLLKILGSPAACGVPRIVRWRQVEDKPAVRGFLNQLADSGHIDMLLLGHSATITDDCNGKLRLAATTV